MSVGGVERKPQGLEGGGKFVIWEFGLELIASCLGGGVGDRLAEVYELSRKKVEFGALRIRKGKWVDRRVSCRDGEVVDVDRCEDVIDGFKAFKQNSEKCVDGERTEWAALEKGVGLEGGAANTVDFEEPFVGLIELVSGIGDLWGKANFSEKVVGK